MNRTKKATANSGNSTALQRKETPIQIGVFVLDQKEVRPSRKLARRPRGEFRRAGRLLSTWQYLGTASCGTKPRRASRRAGGLRYSDNPSLDPEMDRPSSVFVEVTGPQLTTTNQPVWSYRYSRVQANALGVSRSPRAPAAEHPRKAPLQMLPRLRYNSSCKPIRRLCFKSNGCTRRDVYL